MEFSKGVSVFSDPAQAAATVGLRYVSDDTPGISRVKAGSGFTYISAKGARVRDKRLINRIDRLAIPPAWTDVWISPSANTHLAATGRDARGRKQYRYNPEFVRVRDTAKYEHVLAFAEALPDLRKKIARDMSLSGVPRSKVLATIVHLLQATRIRVGNEDYARANGSFGLTTLRDRHVRIAGGEIRFLFKGKSGKLWKLTMSDRRVAKVVRACQELPGQHLFQYADEDGNSQKVCSTDVNSYLREITGRDITAKDFRTWTGTVQAAQLLFAKAENGEAPTKKIIKAAINETAALLGNTPAICRKCYVHPEIIAAYQDGALRLRRGKKVSGLTLEESTVLRFLKRRLKSAQ